YQLDQGPFQQLPFVGQFGNQLVALRSESSGLLGRSPQGRRVVEELGESAPDPNEQVPLLLRHRITAKGSLHQTASLAGASQQGLVRPGDRPGTQRSDVCNSGDGQVRSQAF